MSADDFALRMRLHNPERGLPHWSEAVDWPADRWDPLTNAPTRGYPILHVRGRDADGRTFEPMHYACGDGDGLMPPFNGWFIPVGERSSPGFYFTEVTPVEWQPLRATQRDAARSGKEPSNGNA